MWFATPTPFAGTWRPGPTPFTYRGQYIRGMPSAVGRRRVGVTVRSLRLAERRPGPLLRRCRDRSPRDCGVALIRVASAVD